MHSPGLPAEKAKWYPRQKRQERRHFHRGRRQGDDGYWHPLAVASCRSVFHRESRQKATESRGLLELCEFFQVLGSIRILERCKGLWTERYPWAVKSQLWILNAESSQVHSSFEFTRHLQGPFLTGSQQDVTEGSFTTRHPLAWNPEGVALALGHLTVHITLRCKKNRFF